eukprot:2970826-Rhodomonas_salina.1
MKACYVCGQVDGEIKHQKLQFAELPGMRFLCLVLRPEASVLWVSGKGGHWYDQCPEREEREKKKEAAKEEKGRGGEAGWADGWEEEWEEMSLVSEGDLLESEEEEEEEEEGVEKAKEERVAEKEEEKKEHEEEREEEE